MNTVLEGELGLYMLSGRVRGMSAALGIIFLHMLSSGGEIGLIDLGH